jgi:hypothetical protein
MVGIADQQGGVYRGALHFQRSREFDEQDVALGMDSVYAERNVRNQSGYGGVERVELHRSRVRVVVRGEVAARMGTIEFVIAFALGSEEFERLNPPLFRTRPADRLSDRRHLFKPAEPEGGTFGRRGYTNGAPKRHRFQNGRALPRLRHRPRARPHRPAE